MLNRFGQYMLYDRHPTVLIFFLALLMGGEYLFLPAAWPHLTPTQQILALIVVAGPYTFLWLSAASDPGYITPKNHQLQMAQYPYDFALFHPGPHCRSCQLLKPARSKHCSVCKHCIAKSDHHCIFINNCVGDGNVHWFILLLLSSAVLTLYGTYLGMSIMSMQIKARYPDFSIWPPAADKYDWSTYLIVWSWGLQEYVHIGAVTMLTMLTTPLIWGLWAYNMYSEYNPSPPTLFDFIPSFFGALYRDFYSKQYALMLTTVHPVIYAGTTTNESMKWSDWKLDIDDGIVYRRRMSPTRQKNLRFEPAWTRLPIETKQIMIRDENGMPRVDSNNIPGEGEWTRVQSLKEVDNLYDMGLWENLREVFWPRYRFAPDGGVPVAETGGMDARMSSRAD